MKVHGSHTLPLPPERAYSALQDPVILAACMPGCEKLEKIGDDAYAMKMKMVLAAISGQFEGKVRITEQNPPVSFRLTVEGTGKIGFMNGGGLLTITAAPEGSNVAYDGDVHVGGTLASVGQRLIDASAKLMIKKFFDKLCQTAA